jgi:hypothetical protein
MEIKKCLIIDKAEKSTPFYCSILQKLLFVECTTCTSTDESLSHIYSSRGVDLIIISSSLGEDAVRSFFNQNCVLPPVIIVCETELQAIKLFEIERYADILVGPFDKDRLLRGLSKAWCVKHTDNSVADSSSVFLKCGRITKRFFFDRIEFVEAYGIYCKVYYEGNKVIVNESISNIEILLDKKKFRRIHKSFVINIDNIEEIYAGGILLQNRKDKIPFGPTYKPLLNNIFKFHA